ncbi:hypothetical protein VIGAN_03027600, partial [Vigna angularis var. angularis]
MWLCSPKHHGCRRQCRRSLTGHIRTRVLRIHLVSSPRCRHVLRPLPTVVISVAVTHLNPKNIGVCVCLNEIVSSPLDGLERVSVLAGSRDLLAVLYSSPGEECDGEGHGQTKFHIVPCIIVPS